MTKQQYYLKRAKLLMQIDDAKRLGCKNVIKHSELELTNLENNYKKEHLCNPLFSYFVAGKEMDELIKKEAEPTFLVRITFNSGETCDMTFYHEIAKGTKYSAIEDWAKQQLAKSIIHPENIVSAHFIMGRG